MTYAAAGPCAMCVQLCTSSSDASGNFGTFSVHPLGRRDSRLAEIRSTSRSCQHAHSVISASQRTEAVDVLSLCTKLRLMISDLVALSERSAGSYRTSVALDRPGFLFRVCSQSVHSSSTCAGCVFVWRGLSAACKEFERFCEYAEDHVSV